MGTFGAVPRTTPGSWSGHMLHNGEHTCNELPAEEKDAFQKTEKLAFCRLAL